MLRVLAILIILYFAYRAIRGLVRAVRGETNGYQRPPLGRKSPFEGPKQARREVDVEDAKFKDLD